MKFIGVVLMLICIASIAFADIQYPTGGTITYVDDYIIHTFTSNGTFSVPNGYGVEVEYLVVAGGGGGGAGSVYAGGGGGAGGLLQGSGFIVEGDVPVIVATGGAGGVHAAFVYGMEGGNSSFGSIWTRGGGYGGTYGAIYGTPDRTWNSTSLRRGFGGSGGGHAGWIGSTSNNVGGGGIAGPPRQGYDGGAGKQVSTVNNPNPNWNYIAGGGGGGAGQQGYNAATASGGRGGNGIQSNITGTMTWYAGGGGGSSYGGGSNVGGYGGGGNACHTSGCIAGHGVANTGGGGGGKAGANSTSGRGGNGGSGIVVVRYTAADISLIPVLKLVKFQSHPETTDFTVVNQSSVDNPVLADDFAKVEWNVTGINLTGIDLDEIVDFGHNRITVRSDLFPYLNTTANLTFREVRYAGFESFNVLKDGVICIEPDCVKVSYDPVVVEVQGFSNYTTQGTGEIPEFNAVTLIIGLIVIAVGVVAVRKRQQK